MGRQSSTLSKLTNIIIIFFVCFIFFPEGHGLLTLLRKARCLIPNGIDHLTRALLLQQCVSEKYGQGNETMCFEGLGCFPMESPWVSLGRPFPTAYPPEDIDTRFILYTRNAPDGYNVSCWPSISIEQSDYDPERPITVFLTHGFASSGQADWLLEMKDAYLETADANVFIVDWEKGSSICNYLQAASNTRIVGAEVARFIKYLNNDHNPHIHLVGHSLGAHIMSYAAKTVKPTMQIARITALDPAQPGFEGECKEVRLDKEDAQCVDVIHTDSKPFIPFLGFGMIQPAGHIDFYMNGGAGQPGCITTGREIKSIGDLAKIPVETVSSWVSCSHGRSYEYFTWALKLQNCTMWGRKMSTAENLLHVTTLGNLALAEPVVKALDECSTTSCTVLGLETFKLKARGAFSVTTKSDEPFCETTKEQNEKLKNLLTVGLYGYFAGTLQRLSSLGQGTVEYLKKLR